MICVPINTNTLFPENSAVIVNDIDNVNKFALITNAIIERDFKKEYLFRTCSVGTNLVTSLEFQFRFVLLCCAVSSQLRNSSVFTHSHSDSSAATSTAT